MAAIQISNIGPRHRQIMRLMYIGNKTGVEIAAEAHNPQLLEKLTRGQELQLKLQATVEGLSIAAITYYVVSLALFIGKAMKAYGLNINPELLAGFCTPVVLFFSWRTIQHIHLRLKDT